MEKLTITIREDQKKWLDAHPSTSASGLLQEALDQRMQEVDGYLTMEQFELEKEGLHKKVIRILKDNPEKALTVKTIARNLKMPNSIVSHAKVQFALSNLMLIGKIDSIMKGSEEYFILTKKGKGGEK